ncbi:MAG: hypothetical protein OXC63_08765 [Aestuariivita sp.]|nr:hypothetical protein [Aestuariivita sp.]
MRNITGVAEAVGPQALLIEGIVFNLSGVDAPVSGTTAANLAQQMLARLVDGKVVTCAAKDSIAASRERAICFEGRLDVASALVASGTVLACADVSGAAYRFLETNAARASLRRSGNC